MAVPDRTCMSLYNNHCLHLPEEAHEAVMARLRIGAATHSMSIVHQSKSLHTHRRSLGWIPQSSVLNHSDSIAARWLGAHTMKTGQTL